MIPTQYRAVDPFSSYDSDNVNRITRIVTAGDDKIVRDSDLLVSYLNDTTLTITSGVAIKDDVTLHFPSNMTLDLTDPDNYIIQSIGEPQEMEAPFPAYGYIVLSYQYQKTPDPPIAEIKILKDRTMFNPLYYIFLAMVEFNGPTTTHSLGVTQNDGTLVRPVANLHEAYTDQKARDAQALNPIENHLPSAVEHHGKIFRVDPNTGHVTYISINELVRPQIVYLGASDYDGNNTLIWTHNLGYYPLIQIFDRTTMERILPGKEKHHSLNVMHFEFGNDPYNTPEVMVVYI